MKYPWRDKREKVTYKRIIFGLLFSATCFGGICPQNASTDRQNEGREREKENGPFLLLCSSLSFPLSHTQMVTFAFFTFLYHAREKKGLFSPLKIVCADCSEKSCQEEGFFFPPFPDAYARSYLLLGKQTSLALALRWMLQRKYCTVVTPRSITALPKDKAIQNFVSLSLGERGFLSLSQIRLHFT